MQTSKPVRRLGEAEALSPVFGPGTGPATAVGRPDGLRGPIIGAGAVCLLGAVVFMSLSHGRSARAQTMAPAAPAPAGAMTPSQPAAPAAPAPTPRPIPEPAPAAQAESPDRLRSPAMVVDLSEGPQAAPAAAATAAGLAPPPAAAASGAAPTLSVEERFAARVSGSAVATAQATRLRDTALVAPQGTVIAAILETAINSQLPGFVRAVVSRDVRGFDGSTVLIPRGSKLIGQYNSGVAVGQTRAFVVWSRVITPEGVSVDIGSPSADSLGRGGLDGETHTHFFRRFGASILLSVISSGLQALSGGNADGGGAAVVIGSPQQASTIAEIALQKEIDIPTTITVPQGAPIRVFVARDLDFSGVTARR